MTKFAHCRTRSSTMRREGGGWKLRWCRLGRKEERERGGGQAKRVVDVSMNPGWERVAFVVQIDKIIHSYKM